MQPKSFTEPIAEHVWRAKYQWSAPGGSREPSIEASWDRVALAVASVEAQHRDDWRERFRALLRDFRLLPAGRILANAGTDRSATLFNCFWMGATDSHRRRRRNRQHAVFAQLHWKWRGVPGLVPLLPAVTCWHSIYALLLQD